MAAPHSLAASTVRSAAWLGGGQAIRQANALLTAVVLARTLAPSDYGLFAMTFFINELARLFVDFGVGTAVIQSKTVDQRLVSSCFWINVIVGALAALVVVLSGPLAAGYFHQPLVASLLLVSALNLCLSAVSVLPQALLVRRLEFKHVAVGLVIGSLCGSALALVLASQGFGVWALLWQPLAGTAVTFAYLAWRARWLPSWVLDLGAVRGVIKFSGHLLGGSVVSHLTGNLHQLIVGPLLGASAMGSINMAQTMAWLPIGQVTAVSVKAVYPVFAQMQDSRERMVAGFLRALSTVTLLTFPLLFGLAALADLVTPLVFGAQWAATAPLVVVFCAHSAILCVSFIAGSTLLATGKSWVGFRLTFVDAALVLPTMLWLRHSDVVTVCIGFVAASSVALGLNIAIALRYLGVPWTGFASCIVRPAFGAAATGLLLLALKGSLGSSSPAWQLLALVLIGAVAYLGLAAISNRTALLSTWALLREAFGGLRSKAVAAGP